MSDLSPEAIIAEHHGYFDIHRLMFVCRCGETWPALSDDYDREIELHAAHQLERLRDAGHTIVQVPVVGYKGYGETDADRYRKLARNVEGDHYVGGSNSRAAVATLLRRVSDALAAAASPTAQEET